MALTDEDRSVEVWCRSLEDPEPVSVEATELLVLTSEVETDEELKLVEEATELNEDAEVTNELDVTVAADDEPSEVEVATVLTLSAVPLIDVAETVPSEEVSVPLVCCRNSGREIRICQ